MAIDDQQNIHQINLPGKILRNYILAKNIIS